MRSELVETGDSKLWNEYLKLKAPSDFSNKALFLNELYKASELKRIKSKNNFSMFQKLKPLDYLTLETLYWYCVGKIGTFTKMTDANPTLFEKRCFQLMKNHSRIKVYKSFWIKNFCVDFFIPRYTAALEVDGGIHLNEIKMRKDNFKEIYLQETFRIPVWRVDNSSLTKFIYPLIANLSTQNKKGSKAVKSCLSKIYIETIAYHLPLEDLDPVLGSDLHRAFTHFLKTKK